MINLRVSSYSQYLDCWPGSNLDYANPNTDTEASSVSSIKAQTHNLIIRDVANKYSRGGYLVEALISNIRSLLFGASLHGDLTGSTEVSHVKVNN